MSESPLSVSEITARLKAILENGLPPLWVRGEVSQFTSHRSGHWYFTLSDERSQLSCVLWRGRAGDLPFTPQVGQLVLVFGKIAVYERGGRYQFDCLEIRPAGVGELAIAFEALKEKLAAEGLFALEHKIPLPSYPERIGLATSPQGAALQDILRVARERAPWAQFRLAPCAVQGAGAAPEIAAAIRLLDQSGWPEIIIVGRGGGSPEDLWAFNEAIVVRAIAACRTPIVSAVGHEVDVTLADLAADLRTPTPSAAAEMCLPDQMSLRERLTEIEARVERVVAGRLTNLRRLLQDRYALVLRERTLSIWREVSQRVDELSRQMASAARRSFERRRLRCSTLAARLAAANPANVLARGYAVVRKKGETKPLLCADELTELEIIDVTFHQGAAEAEVKTVHGNV